MALNAKTLIERYGQNISIKKSSNSDLILTKAFVQPLRCDWQSELYGDYVDENKVEQFLYIGFAEHQINICPTTTVIIVENQNYVVKKAENVFFSGQAIYERAVLEKA